jgi:hypothetical protein
VFIHVRASDISGKVLRTRPAGPALDMLIQTSPDEQAESPSWHGVSRADFDYVPSANRGDCEGWDNVARMRSHLPVLEL